MDIGTRIKVRRVERGLTQLELANLVDVSQPRISRIEREGAQSIDLVRRIADALEIQVEDLIRSQ